jgi:hypothetical protein
MTPQQIQQLQAQLGVPATGVLDAATTAAYTKAVGSAVSSNPQVQQYAGSNNADSILNAYESGDWSGVTSLTGQPFTQAQQQSAVQASTNALAPGYNAQSANDLASTTLDLQKNQQGLADTETAASRQFAQDKNTADTNSAANGVLFSGSRVQANNDLRNSYNTADQIARRNAANTASSDTQTYAAAYGTPAAESLSSLYSLPGASTYNANTAARQPGSVTPSSTLTAAYNPSTYNYQGTAPVAQTTAVQTRAAGLLANQANKLSLNGYSNSL